MKGLAAAGIAARSPTAAERIFAAFSRRHPEFPGHGLSMTIVRRAAEQLGGRVWCEGAPGRGATFYFTLERERRR